MNVYIDASALVKRYVSEVGSVEVRDLIARASIVGTSVLSRAEVAAAMARAVRMKLLTREDGASAVQVFGLDWESIIRLQMTELLASRAAALAWEHGLRGYDAVHLAVALFWQEILGEEITLATYDKDLWLGAKHNGLVSWPDGLVKG